MKVRLLALVALLTLTVAGAAIARTNRLTGKVRADGNSRVSLKVVVQRKNRRLRPIRIRSFKFANVDYACRATGTRGEQDGGFRSGRVRLVGRRGRRSYAFQLDKTTTDGVDIAVTGTVNRRGTRVRGSIDYTFSEFGIGGEPDCGSGDVRFAAKRRR